MTSRLPAPTENPFPRDPSMSVTLRTRKLILPGLQLYLTLSFLAISMLALLFQFVVFANTAVNAARELPNDADLFLGSFVGIMTRAFLLSFCVVLPLTVFVGTLITAKVAGPVYRFETQLRQVLEGGAPGPFKIRKGDQLQELNELLSRVLKSRAAEPSLEERRAA